jgi:apyrase
MHTRNDNEIKEAMNFLLNACKNKINEVSKNKYSLSEANFYLKATAGMRSISVEEQNKKLNIIRNAIKGSEFKFEKDDWAKVITGGEEGMFGWITGNYLNKILFDNEKASKIEKRPYGSIDLGGYSLEITFYTSEEIKKHKVDLSMSNLVYSLYSYSFQDYGQDKFNENLLKNIIKSQKQEGKTIKHPCYLNGYKTYYVYDNVNYTIIGNNDIEKCRKTVEDLMVINTEKDMSMNYTYQPSVPQDTMFYGISGLYWIAKFFNLTDDKFHAPKEFLTGSEQFCKKSWEEAKSEYGAKYKKEYIKNYCITGYYVYAFLSKGFKLDENKKLIMFPDKINNVEVSWTLGAMSYEIGLQPLKNAKFYIDV